MTENSGSASTIKEEAVQSPAFNPRDSSTPGRLMHSAVRKTWIFITTNFEGIHCYPGAPEEVSFLRAPHRHRFHVRIQLEVTHSNRDVEFIMFRREIDQMIHTKAVDLQSKSCEMMCEELLNYVIGAYPDRDCIIEVNEDQENGGILEYKAPRPIEGL